MDDTIQYNTIGLNEQVEETVRNKAKLEKVKRDLEAEIEELKDQVEEEEEQKNELNDAKIRVRNHSYYQCFHSIMYHSIHLSPPTCN